MKFTSKVAKKLRVAKGKYVTFTGKSVYETTDKDEIALLGKAKSVTKVTESKVVEK